ncbi:hypothetical protein EW146_g4028 [Bondarzewia mesenterica]|uniref:NTF2 domain-containing protein n=1 Tax=Bondarzewia mesenterica TaxID=1095465 RepID=A0A4S4LVR1_9AGAM|nr:hypothetical protein EW146_g4028 [Bondarzewia mesenterica]
MGISIFCRVLHLYPLSNSFLYCCSPHERRKNDHRRTTNAYYVSDIVLGHRDLFAVCDEAANDDHTDQRRHRNRGARADHFTRLYYTAYDSPTRVDDLPNFYRPNSALTWNGTPFEGAQGVRALLRDMPKTKHEVQSFDCHPIPGAFVVPFPLPFTHHLCSFYPPSLFPILIPSIVVVVVVAIYKTGSQPPFLLVTVSGTVTHGGGPTANPTSAPPKTIEGHPRVFAQTFMLVPDAAATTKVGEVAKYYISADALRFVG